MNIRKKFVKDLQVENMELRELHFMLDKILEEKTILEPISKYLYEIIDDMWNNSEDQFVQMSDQLSIGKKEYIARFIYYVKCIDELIIVKKENIEEKLNEAQTENKAKGYAGVCNNRDKIKLVLNEKNFESPKMLKTILSHEIGHLLQNHLLGYIYRYANSTEYVKGNLMLATIWTEGLAEDSANNNTKSKYPFTKTNIFEFVYQDDKQIYSMRIPQNGYTDTYQPITTIYAELKTILSVKFLEEKIPAYTHLTEEFINCIGNQIQNRELAEKFIIQCITTYEQMDYYKDTVEELYQIEEKQKEDAVRFKLTSKEVDEWNEKVQKKRKEDKKIKFSFETNFIRLQQMFFEMMGEKVKNAETVEEIYQYTNDINHIRKYWPIIFDVNGKYVTEQILRIDEYKQKCSDKISELQEHGKTSNIPYNLGTDSDEVEL